MDIKYNIGYRNKEYANFTINGDDKYDYAQFGVLEKCLPKILFKGNTLLVTFLQLIDTKIIMMLKYIDKLKEFKYISKYY